MHYYNSKFSENVISLAIILAGRCIFDLKIFIFFFSITRVVREKEQAWKQKLPRVSYGDFCSFQFVALATVLLWFTRNQGPSLLEPEEPSHVEYSDGDGKWDLQLGFRNEALDRNWCLVQIMKENTVWGLHRVFRLLIVSETDSTGRINNDPDVKVLSFWRWKTWTERRGSGPSLITNAHESDRIFQF